MRRGMLPGAREELVDEPDREEREGEGRPPRGAVLHAPPRGGGGEEDRDHTQGGGDRARVAEPSVEGDEGRRPEHAPEEEDEVEDVDEERLVAEEGEGPDASEARV